MRATFNGQVIAESDDTIVVEGNHYFPPTAITCEAYTRTDHRTHCPWKGDASYYTISVGGQTAENAAWFYEKPKDAAAEIGNYVAFYKHKVDISS